MESKKLAFVLLVLGVVAVAQVSAQMPRYYQRFEDVNRRARDYGYNQAIEDDVEQVGWNGDDVNGIEDETVGREFNTDVVADTVNLDDRVVFDDRVDFNDRVEREEDMVNFEDRDDLQNRAVFDERVEREDNNMQDMDDFETYRAIREQPVERMARNADDILVDRRAAMEFLADRW